MTSCSTGSGNSSTSQYLKKDASLLMNQLEGGSATANPGLALTFTNNQSTEAVAYLSISANVSGYSDVTPVPEPHTWAMLIAGVGLLGGVALRRARR